jgi:uncharacterized membrane protein
VNIDAVHIVLPLLLLALGVPLLLVGALGWRGTLRPAGRLGVRTPDATTSPEAFALANRVAGPPVAVSGAVAVLGAVAAVLLAGDVGAVLVAVVAFLGALVIAAAGGSLGSRAATRLAAAAPPAGCAGCACGGGGCAALTRG